MNNEEQNKQDQDISPDQFRFLSELLDASHSERCENAAELRESLDTVEVL